MVKVREGFLKFSLILLFLKLEACSFDKCACFCITLYLKHDFLLIISCNSPPYLHIHIVRILIKFTIFN